MTASGNIEQWTWSMALKVQHLFVIFLFVHADKVRMPVTLLNSPVDKAFASHIEGAGLIPHICIMGYISFWFHLSWCCCNIAKHCAKIQSQFAGLWIHTRSQWINRWETATWRYFFTSVPEGRKSIKHWKFLQPLLMDIGSQGSRILFYHNVRVFFIVKLYSYVQKTLSKDSVYLLRVFLYPYIINNINCCCCLWWGSGTPPTCLYKKGTSVKCQVWSEIVNKSLLTNSQ